MPAPLSSASSRSLWARVALLWGVAILVAVLHVACGSTDADKPWWALRFTPIQVLHEIGSGYLGPDSPQNHIVWMIRLPRALACFCVGGILGMVGSAFQALFRNPLAEPYIVGVSSGAAVGGAIALVLGLAGWFAGLGLLAFSFVGGGASLVLVLLIAGRKGQTDVQVLLLAGVVMGALLSALLSMILFAAGLDANQLLRWLLGSATPMDWTKVSILAITLLLGAVLLAPQGKKLNTLAVSESMAQRLGVDTARLKRTLLIVGTAMASISVGSVGVIGFLGLVSPHIARRLLGVDWRWALLGAGGVGATLMVGADILAQRLVPGAELPVGIITAILGAPFLLVLMRRPEA